jgi:methyl-accepting chemotaxis protein
LLDARSAFREHEARLIEYIKAGKIDEGRAYLVKEMLPPQTVYLAAIEDFSRTQVQGMEDFTAEAADIARNASVLMVVIGVVATVLAATVAFALTRSITGPVAEAVRVAQTVAAGNLTSRIDVRSEDQIGQLMRALKVMNESLSNVVGSVRGSTDTIALASTQIAVGNQDLSSRTEEQANQLAVMASEVALKGGAVVSEVVQTMESIQTSSRKVASVISVIDGIAFQTNILALNAAVEAARAGDQGRGFAVVAAEVRNLAQRSAAAAKEIKGLIDESVQKVGEGSELVGQAGETMQEIVGSVRRVTDIMGEISAASHEQTTGIEQISHAISQMDQVTQQNAALVEEAAAAAQSMQEQAEALVRSVSLFKVAEAQHA